MIERLVPPPPDKRLAVRIKPAAERALRAGHPWLFDRAITNNDELAGAAAGDLAVVFDRRRRFLAIGLYDPYSPIRVKILHQGDPVQLDNRWFQARSREALARRAPLAKTDTTGYRIIFGEGDGLPGLIVDRYAKTLVAKVYSAAWFPYLHLVINELLRLSNGERIVLRLSRLLQEQIDLPVMLADGQLLFGSPPTGPVEFLENGLLFAADVILGHKTGTFFDHRDNRAWVRKVARDRRVLDVYAYTGGFSVYAAAGGAASITAVDISRPALEQAVDNLARNEAAGIFKPVPFEPLVGDAVKQLEILAAGGRRFDLVVADPPSFAKRIEEQPAALRAYELLTTRLMALLEPDGVLVMASCSSRVPAALFFETVLNAAGAVDRPLWVHRKSGHPLDHPLRESFPEGAYLKCLCASPIDG